jgi:hypothetical protein
MTGKRGKLGSERHPHEGRWKRQSAIAVEFEFRTIICWQHDDIPLVTDEEKAGISQCILSQTNTPDGRFNIPRSWPVGPNGARYDLVWVFAVQAATGRFRCQ